jgi:hypothetical protein
MGEALQHRGVRAPRENGGKLVEPPLSALGDLIERNVSSAAGYDYDVQGRSLSQLAAQARGELVQAALNYTRSYRDVAHVAGQSERIFLAGHQPQLFHPGVWFKNFVLSAIARRHAGVGVNLIIDSDTIKTACLRVPGGTPAEPRVESLALDRPTAEIPYEERSIIDRQCLGSFGARAAETTRHLVRDPLVHEFWPLVTQRARQCENLGLSLAQARHQQEGLWGASTLEIPQSQVCSLPAFHWFMCHLLARLPRLWEQYNRSVADYRRANRVRSTAHPVPDLVIEDDWLEAPFWIWDRAHPRRRRLFVRQRGDEIVLSDRRDIEFALALSPEGEAGRAAQQLADLAASGIRLRTRALITTLFARLVLGDVFLHGIGGAKYDQVTDLLIERFFGLKPPEYMTLTATLRLGVAREDVGPQDARRVDQKLRDLTYHPERHLEPGCDPSLVSEKRRWIETLPTPDNAKQRARKIIAINEALQPCLSGQRRQLLDERQQIVGGLRAQSMLASREYAFCLFPAEPLRRLMDIPASE